MIDLRYAHCFLTLILALLPFTTPASQPPPLDAVVANAPDPAWHEQVHHHLDRVHRYLCPEFGTPLTGLKVVRTDFSPNYDQLRDAIYIDRDYLPVELYHEYGHWLLDAYLTRRSPAIDYYELRRNLNDRPLSQVIGALERERHYDRRLLTRLQLRGEAQLSGNLKRYMAASERLQERLNRALEQEQRYGARYDQFDGNTAAPSLYQLLAPYQELFADSVSVLMTQSWNAVLMGAQTAATYRALENHLAPGIATLRVFEPNIGLDHPAVAQLDPKDHYGVFLPTRSMIRELAELGYRRHPTDLLRMLAETIGEEIDDRLNHPHHYQLPVRTLNRRLMARLSARVAAQTDRPERLPNKRGSPSCEG